MDQESKRLLNAKEIISFLLAAAVPPLFFVGSMAFPLARMTLFGLVILGFSFAAVYMYAGAHILLFGIPAFLVARKWNAIHWWTCLVAGFLIGSIPTAILTGGGEFIPEGLLGASAGLFFWLLWRIWITSDRQAEM